MHLTGFLFVFPMLARHGPRGLFAAAVRDACAALDDLESYTRCTP